MAEMELLLLFPSRKPSRNVSEFETKFLSMLNRAF